MYINRLPLLVRTELEQSSFIEPWNQHAPVRKGCLTFAHSGGYGLVNGTVKLESINEGVNVSYTSDTPFSGIWAMYDYPPKPTDLFTKFVFRDDRPGEMLLYSMDGETLTNPLDNFELTYVGALALDHIGGKADKVIKARNAHKK